jgi:hypothetical protein
MRMTLIAVREKLKGKTVGLIVGGAMILVAIAISIIFYLSHRTSLNSYVAFYSDDDGKTYYRDNIYNFPPFERDGKVVNRAIVFTNNGQTFVGYLERYTPDAKKKLQDVYDANLDAPYKAVQAMGSMQIYYGGLEWKLPGDGHAWTLRGKGAPNVRPPDGSQDVSNLLVVRP